MEIDDRRASQNSTWSFHDFMETHDFTLVIQDRPSGLDGCMVSLDRVEVKDGGGLEDVLGSGATVDEAVVDLCTQLSERLLVYNAAGPDRYEVKCPKLVLARPMYSEDTRDPLTAVDEMLSRVEGESVVGKVRRLLDKNVLFMAKAKLVKEDVLPKLCELTRLPNTEWVADEHNKALRELRGLFADVEE